jgi:hypothetical protein
VWDKSNQATNNRRNRDDDDNPKENKQREREICLLSSVKTTYSGRESCSLFHYNQTSNFTQEISIWLQELSFTPNSTQVPNLFPWQRGSI